MTTSMSGLPGTIFAMLIAIMTAIVVLPAQEEALTDPAFESAMTEATVSVVQLMGTVIELMMLGLGGLIALVVLGNAASLTASLLRGRRVGSPMSTGYVHIIEPSEAEGVLCVHCQCSGVQGWRRTYSKHLAVAGLSVRRLDWGEVEVCRTCDEDPIEGELIAEESNRVLEAMEAA